MNSKEIIQSVCEIIAYNESKTEIAQGTGFFISIKQSTYVVSNKHVICGVNNTRTAFTLLCNITPKGTSVARVMQGVIQIEKEKIILLNNYDIALYPIDEILSPLVDNDYIFNHYILSVDDMITDYNTFEWIEDVVVVGYPWNMKEPLTNRPIAMSGITSTPLSMNFAGKEDFLIDCGFSHGGSGSPVFIRKDNTYHLIGILYGCIDKTEELEKVRYDHYEITKAYCTLPSKMNRCIKCNILVELQ